MSLVGEMSVRNKLHGSSLLEGKVGRVSSVVVPVPETLEEVQQFDFSSSVCEVKNIKEGAVKSRSVSSKSFVGINKHY